MHQINELLKTKNSEQRASFKVQSVEIRKIHDNLAKFLKHAHQFYSNLLKHFSTRYKNDLIPLFFLRNFDFSPSATCYPISVPDVQANFLSLIHHCLLSLGNLSRHRSFIELSYVNPCLSNSNFWKYKNLTPKSKGILMKPFYRKAIRYYKYCIALIPALNEPYNHIGIIHNLCDDKFNAIYWFLRSNFTRIPNYTLGLGNFSNIMKKKFAFTDYVVDFYNQDEKKPISHEILNSMLICLIGYHYLPEVYHNGPFIVKQIKYTKVESDFFQLCFNRLIEQDPVSTNLFNSLPESHESMDLHLQQLILLACFQKLSEDTDESDKLNRFVLRYLDHCFTYLTQLIKENVHRTKVLVITRFVLNWLRENTDFLKYVVSKKQSLEILSTFQNSLLDSLDTDTSSSQLLSQVMDLLTSITRPSRAYFFHEDVILKDFSVLGYQFKDFRDDHLFRSRNVNLVNGDFSVYFQARNESQNAEHRFADKIPSFFDNSLALKIEADLETCADDAAMDEVIRREIDHYEQESRLQAVLVLGWKLLKSSGFVEFSNESLRFVVTKKLAEATRAKQKGKKDGQKIKVKKEPSPYNTVPKAKTWATEINKRPAAEVTQSPPSETVSSDEQSEEEAIESLEDVIRSHAIKLKVLDDSTEHMKAAGSQKEGGSVVESEKQRDEATGRELVVELQKEREVGLQNMVDSLVLESEHNATVKAEDSQNEQFFSLPPVQGSLNIWKEPVPNSPGPAKASNETPMMHPSQPVFSNQPVFPNQFPNQASFPNQAPFPNQNQFPGQSPFPNQAPFPGQSPFPNQPVQGYPLAQQPNAYPQYQNLGFPYPQGAYYNGMQLFGNNQGFSNFGPMQNPPFPPHGQLNEYPQYRY